MNDKSNVLVVGAGITGMTIAERIASESGKNVLLIDKRNHLGGNCFDFYDKHGILVPLYGPHFFHTDHEEVWRYVNKFTEFKPYKHKVLSNVDGKSIVPIPVNIQTVNTLFNENLKNEEEMEDWLRNEVEKIENPKNSEEVAMSNIGRRLYEKLIKNYTKKQWDLWPHELSVEVIKRIPVRKNFEDGYYSNVHQGIPKEGYFKMFEKMAQNDKINIRLNTNFFDLKEKKFDKIIFTGKIDSFFKNSGLNPLLYRSLKFEFDTLNQEYFQNAAVVNYPNNYDYTRITEPKHATGQIHEKTTIIKEYPCWGEEPYYPVFSHENKQAYAEYAKLAKEIEDQGVYFVGRLAEFKYLDIDSAIKNAFEFLKNKIF